MWWMRLKRWLVGPRVTHITRRGYYYAPVEHERWEKR